MVAPVTEAPANPYLDDFLAPVNAEVTATDLPVTGHIPDFLDGRYLRNGPNPVAEVDPATYHWFSGDGMVHGVALHDGKARWYRNRWVRNSPVCASPGRADDRRAQPARRNAVRRPEHQRARHAGQTLALVEGGGANYGLTDDLDTEGPCDFDGTLSGGYAAHPHRDPPTGELHAISYSFARGHTVQYSVIDTEGHARRTVDIEVTGSPMMHDFSLTEKYVVIYDLPVTFDPVQVLPTTMPRWMRASGATGGRNRCSDASAPEPDLHDDQPQWTAHSPDALRVEPRHIRRASGSCPATAATLTSGGSRSNPATSTTRSTLTPRCGTATRCWCSTWCATSGCSTATCADRATAGQPWTAGRST